MYSSTASREDDRSDSLASIAAIAEISSLEKSCVKSVMLMAMFAIAAILVFRKRQFRIDLENHTAETVLPFIVFQILHKIQNFQFSINLIATTLKEWVTFLKEYKKHLMK